MPVLNLFKSTFFGLLLIFLLAFRFAPSPWQLYIFEEVKFQVLLPAKPEVWQLGYHSVQAKTENFACKVTSFVMGNKEQGKQLTEQTTKTLEYTQKMMGVKLVKQHDFQQGKYQVRELVLKAQDYDSKQAKAVIVRMIATPSHLYQVMIAYRQKDSAKIQSFFRSFKVLK